ncbi:hypothetical protein NSU_2647 [Novosphingobium pentaromativorans US6-1]|uniref:Uncharacterized protein n=1 Tax=Novosphingobium pentaromativorans US6-1 TaxID=1088721 RepID=G6EE75_9SPHN|nr:hypothetical protein NSU_2647 [Novosphingobium pentaromativorans US6-1]
MRIYRVMSSCCRAWRGLSMQQCVGWLNDCYPKKPQPLLTL